MGFRILAYEGEALVENVIILETGGRDLKENEAKNINMPLLNFLTRNFKI